MAFADTISVIAGTISLTLSGMMLFIILYLKKDIVRKKQRMISMKNFIYSQNFLMGLTRKEIIAILKNQDEAEVNYEKTAQRMESIIETIDLYKAKTSDDKTTEKIKSKR